jgi:3-oxoacyl-[acyl-carrier protein] reductase
LIELIQENDGRECNHSSELRGMTAVVTGSARGIGRAIALELAAAGAQVVVHGRVSADAAAEVCREIEKLGRASEVILCDLADSDQRRQLVERAWKWQGSIDIWVNNAGAASWSFDEKLRQLWQVDVLATVELARLVGRRMKQRGRGVLLNVGWDQAEQGMAGESGELFATVKGAIMAFTRSLAQSLAPEVRVNCLAPGWIKTGWGEQASESWQRRATQDALLQRWGTPSDVARVARFLASPAAAFVAGQIVAVNGGFRFGSHTGIE